MLYVWYNLLVPAYPGCPGSKAVKRSLLLMSQDSRRQAAFYAEHTMCYVGTWITRGGAASTGPVLFVSILCLIWKVAADMWPFTVITLATCLPGYFFADHIGVVPGQAWFDGVSHCSNIPFNDPLSRTT